ncbi:MAG: hypothetical protein GWN31_05420 [Candidatus Thorarchaeota archaeon]|nr:hypothetical protein [Candidatus Thorarchaeota archaeon]NIW13367.1 hypothetical protein [Candidatus Thorarchaeota archaeon]NIW51467.1 hypothetical protein [Candidatus Korarchaeota archaeon]
MLWPMKQHGKSIANVLLEILPVVGGYVVPRLTVSEGNDLRSTSGYVKASPLRDLTSDDNR